MKISLIASSVRMWLWDEMMESIYGNDIEYEVVLAGNLSKFQVRPYIERYPQLKYFHTADCICPTQCYEIARRNATGELIMWIADDCEFSDRLLDKVYDFFQKLPEKSLISVKTNENSMNNVLDDHTILGGNRNTPLMAPLGVMSREYLDKLGGFDRRYLCGQYENDVAMRVYADGGDVVKYEEGCVYIEHLKKHGEGTKFWTGYNYDRSILEGDWVVGEKDKSPISSLPFGCEVVIRGFNPPEIHYHKDIDNRQILKKSKNAFQPYEDKDLLTVSQCPVEWGTK